MVQKVRLSDHHGNKPIIIQCTAILMAVKIVTFSYYIVQSVLTSVHNLWSRVEIRKIMFMFVNPSFTL